MMLEDFSVSIRPAEPPRLTGPEEEHDAEHGEDGGHHHPEEGVQLSGILLGGPGVGGARLRGLLLLAPATRRRHANSQATHPGGQQGCVFVGHGQLCQMGRQGGLMTSSESPILLIIIIIID